MNYNEILNNINKNYSIKSFYYSFCDVNFSCSFNNDFLFNKFNNIIYPYIKEIKLYTTMDFSIKSIVDDYILKSLKTSLLQENRKQIFTMTYCSTEKGTIKVNKYIFDNYIIFEAIKSDAILIMNNNYNEYIYITSNENMLNNNFFKDYYMFFEHILHKKCNEKGSILVHASAVNTKDGVILFVGKKRSGKTTMLFECCKKLDCNPLSVDKVHLKFKNNKIKVYGFPTRLRVLSGTLSRYKELKNIIPMKYKNASEDELWKGKSDSKVDIEINKFEHFVNKKIVSYGNLNKIVLNTVTKEINKETFFYENYKSQCINTLLENIYTPYNPEEDWWSNISINKCDEMENNKNYLLNYIYSSIPIISLNAKNHIVGLMEKILLNPDVRKYEIISN
ncbi:hypothetical protein OSC52_03020 [Clostridium pasteurianum]|uniref:hypothetical protein n=1 Tax=Clostridium pasteurianum TaxID=1501 RepID=UPI002260E32A|nr:hypothetical protein [Clostridium pasteurianum]UZW14834.1 hypothetical protein OSC52_03020 [Clostridium pasteurianum]